MNPRNRKTKGLAPATKLLRGLLTGLAALLTFAIAEAATLQVPADHPTIQAAINAANQGDIIVVAAGTYTESIHLNKDVTIRGANAGVAAGPNPGSRGIETIIDGGFIVSAAGATIDGVTIQNGRLSGSVRVGVAVAASNVTVTNTIIENVSSPAQSDGLSTQTGNNNLTLTHSTIRNNWRGIYLNPGSGHILAGNLITNNNGVGVGIGSDGQSDLTLTDNTISNHDLEGWGASAVGSNVVASGNSFIDNEVSVAHYGGSAIDANGNYWGPDGPDGAFVGDVTVLTHFTSSDFGEESLSAPVRNVTQSTVHATIHDAVAAAQAGDVLKLRAQEYTGASLTINKSLTILGPNGNMPGNDDARGGEAVISNLRLTVTAAGTVIDGVEILQTNDTSDAILVQAAATVKNSIIRREGVSTGTVTRGLTTSSGLDGYIISDNLFTGDASGGMFGGHKSWNSGVYLNGGSGTLSGNVFENCRTAVNADDFNAGIEITGNVFRECGSYLSFGGTVPTAGTYKISGNEFGIDWTEPTSLPSAFFNNSNVATTFRLDAVENTYGGIESTELGDAQKLAIEARNFHRGRSGRNGVVDFLENEQVVFLPFTTIASAVAAADSGDTVLVSPGDASESMTINKSLTLRGSNWNVPAADGSGAAPAGRGAETVWTVPTEIWPNAHNITIDGFHLKSGERVIRHNNIDTDNFVLKNSIVENTAAGANEHIHLFGPAVRQGWQFLNNRFIGSYNNGTIQFGPNDTDALVQGNDFMGAGNRALFGAPSNLVIRGNYFDSSNVTAINLNGLDNPLIENNQVRVSGFGFQLTTTNGGLVRNNVFTGVSAFNFGGINYMRGIDIFGSAFDGPNSSGLIIEGNEFHDFTSASISPDDQFRGIHIRQGAEGITIQGNAFSNTHTALATVATAPHVQGVVFFENVLSGVILGIVNGSPEELDATKNFWGDPTGPEGLGASVGANVLFSPWYADPSLVYLVTSANFEPLLVPAGATEVREDLFIGPGATVTVRGRLELTGSFELAPGAVLEVVGGDLVLPDGSLLSGTFTFFNSLGSIHIDGDTLIDGQGLILVSDVHVADGTTITVTGSLVIDGSRVDSDGTFTVDVTSGAEFTMARTRFEDGNISVSSGNSRIFDNRFTNATVAVTAAANGARVFHNIIDVLTNITDNGVGTIQVVDGWGNVTNASFTQNDLFLGWDISGLPATRTIDSNGNAYIQPNDPISATVNVAKLGANKIAAVEMLLGYSTDYFGGASLGLGPNWEATFGTVDDSTGVIGKFDTGVGLNFLFPDPEGTSEDQIVADLGLVAKADAEGTTEVFHRVRLATDDFGGETRLTTGGPSPGYLTPFTSNTPMVIIDGTPPLIDLTTATIEQDNEDLAAVIAVQGTIEISASAFDALAGIDDGDAVVTLVGPETYTATQVSVGAGPTIAGDDYTAYGFEYVVTPSTLNGLYNVVFTVTDRSGNVEEVTLGSVEINKNQISAEVRLEGLAAGEVTRDVTFVFTNGANAVLETRTRSVTFTNGIGSVTFADVNGNTANLSANAATHLRRRLPVVFDHNGQTLVEFDGANLLKGGDLNGDNVVNTLDFSILRFYWANVVAEEPAAVAADITGSGVVNQTDFNILQANFFQQGDPQ